MGFSRQGYWSGLPCPPPGDLPDPGMEAVAVVSLALAGGFFTTSVAWDAPNTNPKTVDDVSLRQGYENSWGKDYSSSSLWGFRNQCCERQGWFLTILLQENGLGGRI